MQNKISKRFVMAVSACMLALVFLLLPANASAMVSASYTNPETGYSVYIEDGADLIRPQEEALLLEDMKPVTQYCSVLFFSTNKNEYYNTQKLAQEKTYEYYQYNGRGTSFIIDMDKRNIWIYSRGGVENEITKSYADTITDNTYTYASGADYYRCAAVAFEQMYKVLDGQRIAMPMKYTSNVLLAVIFGFFISFVCVLISMRSSKPSNADIINSTNHKLIISNPQTVLTSTTKRYSPRSSGGGGGGGGGGGHSGGGGGHGGGGGGGHGF